eukprot:GHUV01004329.1.p1 GENE.GHUV01004329.1~~GHUV01004329.1.p1  ORF type:complete len:655 (+),score=187.00 GHUV01004329.1:210-2174(+)
MSCVMSIDPRCSTRTAHLRTAWPHTAGRRIRVSLLAARNGKDGSPADGQQQEHSKGPAASNGGTAASSGSARSRTASQVLLSAVKPAAGSASWRPDARVMFAIPPANLYTPTCEVLHCPTMRDLLGQPRPSPLGAVLAGIWEGKYASDDDRVALNVMDFASPASTGANAFVFNMMQQRQQQGNSQTTPSGSDSTAPSSGHLAMMSGVYGSFTSMDGSSLASVDVPGGSGSPQVCLPLPPFAVRAGPRDHVYFDSKTVTAAIVTTGNICPGMNDVIESMVKRLHDYGVPEDNILGIKYGIRGFNAKDAKPVVLTRKTIEGIHLTGGTILGTSYVHRHHHHTRHQQRQQQQQQQQASASPSGSNGSSNTSMMCDTDEDETTRLAEAAAAAAFDDQDAQLEAILDKLDFWRINILCVIGGQGGNQLGAQLAAGCQRRGIPCCVVGVPKSIDNDVMLVDKTFGFDTVVQEVVQRPLLAAKVEAASARKGVGLVKVFGRRSGFIALQASLASGGVDVCLIPEEPFELDGPQGLLEYLKQLVEKQGHAVICVAEGAGQDILYPGGEEPPVDESGNPVLRDIGTALKKAIKGAIPDADVKYIDPTYMVQAVPCNSQDHIYCRVLGFHAVDAAMAGYTGVTVGQVNGHFVLLPSSIITMSAR